VSHLSHLTSTRATTDLETSIDDVASITVNKRRVLVLQLTESLNELSGIAREVGNQSLETTLCDLSVSFKRASREIAEASCGPLVIERLSRSVERIAKNLSAGSVRTNTLSSNSKT
jgi:hypothetical protein